MNLQQPVTIGCRTGVFPMTLSISRLPLLVVALATANLLGGCGGGSAQEPLKRKSTLR